MKILSDEDIIWTELIDRLNELGSEYDCSFIPFPRALIAIAASQTSKCQRFVVVRARWRYCPPTTKSSEGTSFITKR